MADTLQQNTPSAAGVIPQPPPPPVQEDPATAAMGKHTNDLIMQALRRDFGQGVEDLTDNQFLTGLHKAMFPDLTEDQFFRGIGKTYGGVYIKKPTVGPQASTFNPTVNPAEQLNVPVMPTEVVHPKPYANPAIEALTNFTTKTPVVNWIPKMAGALGTDIAAIPKGARVLGDLLSQDSKLQPTVDNPFPATIPNDQQRQQLGRAAAATSMFMAPEIAAPYAGEIKALEDAGKAGSVIAGRMQDQLFHKGLSQAIQSGASSGAVYNALQSKSEGDDWATAAVKAGIGAGTWAIGAGLLHGLTNVAIPKTWRALKVGFGNGGGADGPPPAAAGATTVPPATTVTSRIISRGVTPDMQKSFADVFGPLADGTIDPHMAAAHILTELGAKADPDAVNAFAAKLAPFHATSEAAGIDRLSAAATPMASAPTDASFTDPFGQHTVPDFTDNPVFTGRQSTDTGEGMPNFAAQNATPTASDAQAPNDVFGYHAPGAAPYQVPGEVQSPVWGGVPPQVPTEYPQGAINPNPETGIVAPGVEKYPQGVPKGNRPAPTFNPQGLSPNEQAALLRANRMGRQPMLPAPEDYIGTGKTSDLNQPIWGYAIDKETLDPITITGKTKDGKYIGRDTQTGQEIIVPNSKIMPIDLKGPDKSIPLPPGKGKTVPWNAPDLGIVTEKGTGKVYKVIDTSDPHTYKVATPERRVKVIRRAATDNPNIGDPSQEKLDRPKNFSQADMHEIFGGSLDKLDSRPMRLKNPSDWLSAGLNGNEVENPWKVINIKNNMYTLKSTVSNTTIKVDGKYLK